MPHATNAARFRLNERSLVPLVAAALALVSFSPALGAGYVYDDTLLIANNPLVQSPSGVLAAFHGHFWQAQELAGLDGGLTYYRPLVTLSYVLNWLAGAGAPLAFHLVNLGLHALAAYLAARVALRWLSRPSLALLIVALFAVHPTRAESVIWIAGRTDVLMSALGLLAVELAHQARRSQRALDLGWPALASVAALLCKESAVVLPLLLLADALVDEPSGLLRRSRQTLLVVSALCLLYLILRLTLWPVRTSASSFLPAYGFMTVATYAERLLWPWPQTFFYRNLLLGPTGAVYPWPLVLAGAALTLIFVLGVWRALRRDRPAGLALLAAGLLLAPVLNFFDAGVAVCSSDRFLYLPLLLLLLGAGRLLPPLRAPLMDRALTGCALAVALISLLPNTLRARDFVNNQTLWARELALNPNNPVALDWMSSELARAGNTREAAELLERAMQPAARRHFLLDRSGSATRPLRRVALRAASTADGDAPGLRRLYDELRSRPAPANSQGRGAHHAELATLASRLGFHDEARSWLAQVADSRIERLPNPFNLVLVQARLGAYDQAFASLQQLTGSVQTAQTLDPAARQELVHRLKRAQALRTAAEAAEGRRQLLLGAQSDLELGSYGVVCRALRVPYQQQPDDEALAQLYAQALIAARLDAQAERVVSLALGPARATEIVAGLRAQLPLAQRKLAAVAADREWWRTE
jgi:hypothetical protein